MSELSDVLIESIPSVAIDQCLDLVIAFLQHRIQHLFEVWLGVLSSFIQTFGNLDNTVFIRRLMACVPIVTIVFIESQDLQMTARAEAREVVRRIAASNNRMDRLRMLYSHFRPPTTEVSEPANFRTCMLESGRHERVA